MFQETIEQARVFLGRIVPSLTTIIFILLSGIPIHLPGLSNVFPNLVLISIFYWGLYRPEAQGMTFIFIISFLQDVLLNMPFGVNAVANLALHWLILTQRHFFLGRSFFWIWLTFAGMSIVPQFLSWLIYSIAYSTTITAYPLIFQYLLTLSVYPLFAWLLIHIHRLIIGHE